MTQETNALIAERARFALQLIESETFTEVVQTLKQDYMQLIINSQQNEQELREFTYLQIRALEAVVAHIQAMMEAVSIAEHNQTI